MIKNNIKVIFLYLLIQIINIILFNIYNTPFDPAEAIYNNSYKLIMISSILYILLGFTLTIQKNKYKDIKSILCIGLINSISLFIVVIFYNEYTMSNYIQSTSSLSTFLENLMSVIQISNISQSFIIGFPFFKNINKYFILLGGIYPMLMFFISIQLKKIYLKK